MIRSLLLSVLLALSASAQTLTAGPSKLAGPSIIPQTQAPPTITYVIGNGQGGGSTTCTAYVDTTAGDLAIVNTTWSGAGITVTSVSDGTNTFTADPNGSQTDGNSDYGEMFYLLSTASTGTKGYTVTWSADTGGSSNCNVISFHKTPGTWSYDTSAGAGGDTNAINTGSFTTANPVEAVYFGYQITGAGPTITNNLVAGQTPTIAPWTGEGIYYYISSATLSGACTASLSITAHWVASCIAFK